MPYANAAIIKDGVFSWVGKEKDIKTHMPKSGEIIDLNGKCVIPGFNDSHMHYIHYVKKKMSTDLNGATSIDDIISRMKKSLEKFDKQSGMFLIGEGWNQDKFTCEEKRFPNAGDLDKISKDVPILIMRACYHVGVLNHKGMEIIGLDRKKAADLGNLAEKDENGNPSGIIRENYFDDVKSSLPSPSVKTLLDMAIDSQKDLFECGITTIQTDDFKYLPTGKAYDFYKELKKASEDGRLKINYDEQLLCETPNDIENIVKSRLFSKRPKKFKVSAVKILSDGSLGARSAFLRKNYADDNSNRGIPLYTQKSLDEMVMTANKCGMPAIIHAIGDGALSMCQKAFKKSKKHLRNGIVHCQITSKKQIERFKELGLCAFTQPIFIDYDMHIVYDRVCSKLAKTSYNWKRYIDLGIHEAFGTDCPVEKFDPMDGIYCAVTRCDLKGNGPYLKKQKVSVYDAIKSYTLEGAYMTFEEKYKGCISKGFKADYVVLNGDIETIPKSDIPKIKVLKTFIDGNCVFDNTK